MFGTKKNKEADFITTAEPLKLTTIATGTVLKGIIEVEGSLRVDGVIEGDVTCHKMVVIGARNSDGKYNLRFSRTARNIEGGYTRDGSADTKGRLPDEW